MKPSHFTTPRTMSDATWQPWGEAIERTPSGLTSRVFDVLWATIVGIAGALFLAHWMAS